MNGENRPEHHDEFPRYERPERIAPSGLSNALNGLPLFGDDPFLRMQAFNLAIVDQFLTPLEYQVLEKLLDEERTPAAEAAFLSAQSQMWIFAAYEIIRTWRQRIKDILRWHGNGTLEAKLNDLEENVGYPHSGREIRASQLKQVLTDPSMIDRIRDALKLTHMLFAQMNALRISIAKHEVAGRRHSVALRPGYGRINQWCGSLDYELENGAYSMGYLSRRDIADGIRSLLTDTTPPNDEAIAAFDEYMRGPVGDWPRSGSSGD